MLQLTVMAGNCISLMQSGFDHCNGALLSLLIYYYKQPKLNLCITGKFVPGVLGKVVCKYLLKACIKGQPTEATVLPAVLAKAFFHHDRNDQTKRLLFCIARGIAQACVL